MCKKFWITGRSAQMLHVCISQYIYTYISQYIYIYKKTTHATDFFLVFHPFPYQGRTLPHLQEYNAISGLREMMGTGRKENGWCLCQQLERCCNRTSCWANERNQVQKCYLPWGPFFGCLNSSLHQHDFFLRLPWNWEHQPANRNRSRGTTVLNIGWYFRQGKWSQEKTSILPPQKEVWRCDCCRSHCHIKKESEDS